MIEARVLKQSVYKFEDAVNDKVEIYLSVSTLNIGELSKGDCLVIRYGDNAYILRTGGLCSFSCNNPAPDDKYWNHESEEYIKAYDNSQFKEVKVIDKIKWQETGMPKGQRLRYLSSNAESLVEKIINDKVNEI